MCPNGAWSWSLQASPVRPPPSSYFVTGAGDVPMDVLRLLLENREYRLAGRRAVPVVANLPCGVVAAGAPSCPLGAVAVPAAVGSVTCAITGVAAVAARKPAAASIESIFMNFSTKTDAAGDPRPLI